MKKTIAVAAAVTLIGLKVCAQGTVHFVNIAFDLNAPVFLSDGTTLASGPDYTAALLAGPTASTLAQIATTPLLSGSLAGYFQGGTQTITTVPAGGPAFILIEVWNSANFTSFAAAQSANKPNSWGWSGNGNALFLPRTGSPLGNPTTPADFIGLTSFNLNAAVPEPSTLALASVGVVTLLTFRKTSRSNSKRL